MRRKISLITGANGFIGANLVRRLLKDHFDIHITLRKNSSTWRIKDIKNRLKIHIVDIAKKKDLKNLFNKINASYIFHLAVHGSYPHQTNLPKMINTNIKGLENILESSKNLNYKSLIVAGSSSEYGYKRKPMKETDLLEPASYYAATKASATLIAQAFAKLHNKPITILRLFSVYGPFEEPTRFIPTAITSTLRKKNIYLTPRRIRRDFIFIDDVIDAIMLAAKTPLQPGEIINIGTGKQYANNYVIKILGKLLEKRLKIEKSGYKPRMWDTDYWVADNKKAQRLLHWHPKFSLDSGLSESIKWFKENINLYP